MESKYGLLPFQPDERDLRFADLVGAGAGILPDHCYPLIGVPATDQGTTKNCCGHGVAMAITMLLQDAGRLTPLETQMRPSLTRVSEHYIQFRREPGQWQGEGFYTRDALKNAQKRGIVLRKDYWRPGWSYGDYLAKENVSMATIDSIATSIKIGSYALLRSFGEIKAAKAAKHAVVLGVQAWSHWDAFRGLVMPMPGKRDYMEGGHLTCVTGYDERGLLVVNSWGQKWGSNGYFYYPYSYGFGPGGISEAWAFTLAK